MANPVMSRIDQQARQFEQSGQTPNGYPTMPGYQPGAGTQTAPQMNPSGYQQTQPEPQQWQDQQAYPGAASTSVPMSMDDVIIRTAIMFLVVVAAAAGTWFLAGGSPRAAWAASLFGTFGGFALAMVNIFKRQPSPVLMLLYSAFEGIALGAISMVFNLYWPGIVVQAVVATFAVFGVTLLLFSFGKVRMTSRMNKFLLIGLFGLIGFWLVSMVLRLTGLVTTPLGNITVMGIPLGIIIGVVAIVLAAMSLIQDFTVAQEAVKAGLPKEYSWQCAFGIIVSLVWLYTELLRFLSYFHND